jgi:hypothetical protein
MGMAELKLKLARAVWVNDWKLSWAESLGFKVCLLSFRFGNFN